MGDLHLCLYGYRSIAPDSSGKKSYADQLVRSADAERDEHNTVNAWALGPRGTCATQPQRVMLAPSGDRPPLTGSLPCAA